MDHLLIFDLRAILLLHTHLRLQRSHDNEDFWARCPMAKILDLHSGDPRSIRGGSMYFKNKDELVNITNHIQPLWGRNKGSG